MSEFIRGHGKILVAFLACYLFEGGALAAPPESESAGRNRVAARPLSLAPEWEHGGKNGSAARGEREKETGAEGGESPFDVDEFFNVRSAISDVGRGESELEIGSRWFTGGGEGDDDFLFVAELAYGLTDDAFVELKLLPVNIGDGGDQGNGDLELEIFNRFVHETDSIPSIALSAGMRIPSGEGSSSVDGELRLHLTKTIAPRFRAHALGFVESANGGRTEEKEEEGHHFLWGAGVGLDYEFSDELLGIVNYLHQASEEEGNRNEQFLELGINYKTRPGQSLKVASDIGLTGVKDEPNFGVKLQYEIELK